MYGVLVLKMETYEIRCLDIIYKDFFYAFEVIYVLHDHYKFPATY